MRVVALISGGKDSTYAMMKCVEHGHTIAALANLYPPAQFGEEMDSFMYQSVGHAHIDSIAEAMELPLFRREIVGRSINQALRYDQTAGDEVEDLHALLSEVLAKMPEVQAVCAGAVLSNYQRSRVETVCERLGLASLAYLWQRDQTELLAEMVGAGVCAVLVKVASLGLTRAHLGRTVGELQPTFHKLNARFGFHVCGEGGEYESFTLDCPLFKQRLEPINPRVLVHSSDVSILSFERVHLCAKAAADGAPPAVPDAAPDDEDETKGAAEDAAVQTDDRTPTTDDEDGSTSEGVVVSTEGVVVSTEGVVVITEGVGVSTEGVAVSTEGVVVSVEDGSMSDLAAPALDVSSEAAEIAREATWSLTTAPGVGPDGAVSTGAGVAGDSDEDGLVSVALEGGLVHVAVRGRPVRSAWRSADDATDADGASSAHDGASSSATQLTEALGRLGARLAEHGVGLGELLLLRLYVADMREYARINAAFSAFFTPAVFTGCPPAARLAVELPLGSGDGVGCGEGEGPGVGAGAGAAEAFGGSCRVAVEGLAWAGEKRLLHVQSISEWAPRMIGPYCQLTVGQGLCYVAGSLGLVPSTMRLTDGGAGSQAALALRNCSAVLAGLGLSSARAQSLVIFVTHAADAAHVRAVGMRWLEFQCSSGQRGVPPEKLPPLLVLQVGALPLGALVEAQLEAREAGAQPLMRERWTQPLAPHGEIEERSNGELLCDVVVARACLPSARTAPPDATKEALAAAAEQVAQCPPPLSPPSTANGLATLQLRAQDGATLSTADVSAAIVAVVTELEKKLGACSPPLTLCPSLYARISYDVALRQSAAALGSQVGEAVSSAGKRRCVAFAVPVVRVLGPHFGVRLAVQLYFAASILPELS